MISMFIIIISILILTVLISILGYYQQNLVLLCVIYGAFVIVYVIALIRQIYAIKHENDIKDKFKRRKLAIIANYARDMYFGYDELAYNVLYDKVEDFNEDLLRNNNLSKNPFTDIFFVNCDDIEPLNMQEVIENCKKANKTST